MLLGLLATGCKIHSDEKNLERPSESTMGELVWDVSNWINSESLTLKQLNGKVVLIRWWTGPECPYCLSSLPLLQTWYERFRDDGLMVVGLYHHKGPGRAHAEDVEQLVRDRAITFPVAIDWEWKTLKRWYLDHHPADFTSISMLIGRDGVLRFVQKRGDLMNGNAPALELEAELRKALGESIPVHTRIVKRSSRA